MGDLARSDVGILVLSPGPSLVAVNSTALALLGSVSYEEVAEDPLGMFLDLETEVLWATAPRVAPARANRDLVVAATRTRVYASFYRFANNVAAIAFTTNTPTSDGRGGDGGPIHW